MTKQELLKMTPYEGQQEAGDLSESRKVSFGFVNGGGGKTLCSLFLALRRDYPKIIVITLAQLLPQGKQETLGGDNMEYISIETIRRREKTNLPDATGALIIFDECDKGFSSTTTKSYKNINYMVRQCEKFVGLSATMFDTIKGENVFTFFKLADPKIKITELKAKHCIYADTYVRGHKIQVVSGYRDIDSLLEQSQEFTYTKITPQKQHTLTERPTLPKQTSMSNSLKREDIERHWYDVLLYNTPLSYEMKVARRESMFRGEAIGDSGQKYDILKNLCSGIYKSGETELIDDFKFKELDKGLDKDIKILVYYNKAEEYNIFKERYPNQFFSVDKDLERFKAVDCGIMFCNYTSLSRGADISDISSIIYFSPTPVYADWKQAHYRIGRDKAKHKDVYEIFFIVPNSIEEDMGAKIRGKQNFKFEE